MSIAHSEDYRAPSQTPKSPNYSPQSEEAKTVTMLHFCGSMCLSEVKTSKSWHPAYCDSMCSFSLVPMSLAKALRAPMRRNESKYRMASNDIMTCTRTALLPVRVKLFKGKRHPKGGYCRMLLPANVTEREIDPLLHTKELNCYGVSGGYVTLEDPRAG